MVLEDLRTHITTKAEVDVNISTGAGCHDPVHVRCTAALGALPLEGQDTQDAGPPHILGRSYTVSEPLQKRAISLEVGNDPSDQQWLRRVAEDFELLRAHCR